MSDPVGGPVLVTGAGGFAGRHLVERLRDEPGTRIVGVDRVAAPDVDEMATLDLGDEAAVDALVARVRPARVFHLAGVMQGDAATVLAQNVVPAAHLLDAVRRHAPAARVLLVGSAAEYGIVPAERQPVSEDESCLPLTPYGIAKHAVTRLGVAAARLDGLRVTVARPFNLVGAGVPRSLVAGAVVARLGDAIRDALRAAPADGAPNDPLELRVGNVDTRRDFIAVEDAVDLFVRLLDADDAPWGEVFNVCSGEATPIASLVAALAAHAGRPVRVVVDPSMVRPNDVPLMVGDPTRLARRVGAARGTPLDRSLRAAWEHAASATPVLTNR